MNVRDFSKGNVLSQNTLEHLNAGSLQRIADATEVMARRFNELIAEAENYKRWYYEERSRKEAAHRSNRALRGQITKLNIKLANCRANATD